VECKGCGSFFRRFLGARLGAGIIVSVMEHFLGMRKERWQRRRDFLDPQLHIYGSAYCLTNQMAGARTRMEQIDAACEKVVKDEATERKDRPLSAGEQRRLESEDGKVDATGWRYKSLVDAYCDELYERLRNGLHLLDPEDMELVKEFLEGYDVSQIEAAGSLPPKVWRQLPHTHLITPALLQRITEKFERKQRELAGTIEPPGTILQLIKAWRGKLRVKAAGDADVNK